METEARALFATVWDAQLFGAPVAPLVAAATILLAAWTLRRWLGRRLRGWAEALTRRTESQLDDRIGAALEPPLSYAPLVFGVFVAGQILALDGLGAQIYEAATKSFLAGLVFWALARLIDPLSYAAQGLERSLTPEMTHWLWKAARWAVYLVGGATILEIWGVNVAAVIAGFGLLGVAVALGAQDLFKNLISGFLILTERRFRVGDWVRVDGVVEGTVEAITFRSTKVRRFDQAPVYVPNAKFADGAVVNFGEMTHRRIYWTLRLDQLARAAQLREIRSRIERFIQDDDRFLPSDEASTFVRLDAVGDSSIELMIYCFTKTRNWGVWLEVKEDLLLAVKEIVEDAGSEFAWPAHSVRVIGDAEASPSAANSVAIGAAPNAA